VQEVVHRFGDLDAIVNATEEELAAVEGVGPGRAREIREGLRSLQEVDFVDRYP
jgi:diadenylate cyclase